VILYPDFGMQGIWLSTEAIPNNWPDTIQAAANYADLTTLIIDQG
jgi:hypothetical protein